MATWTRAPFLFADDVMQDAHNLQRGMAITLLNNIQLLAPVDTGAYRGSTVVSFGSPDYRYTENIGGMSIAFNAIETLTPNELPTVFIQTNSPYAEVLENGHSSQAPQGVYKLAYESMVASYT